MSVIKSLVYFMEKNIRGAWVVWGVIGMRQYYYYTKAQARQMYLSECSRTYFVNQKGEC